MIGDTADVHELRPQITADRREIRMHPWSHIGIQPRLALLRAENDVENDVAEGLGHSGMMTESAGNVNRAFSAGDL